jgi:hypothetical protein
MTAAQHWMKSLLSYKPKEWETWAPWAFVRPDGSVATSLGGTRATLLIDGNHTDAAPVEYTAKGPGVRPSPPSGKVIDYIFGHESVTQFACCVGDILIYVPESFAVAGSSQKCNECEGTGETECFSCGHDCECKECDGTGEIEVQEDPEIVLVKIGGHTFDTRLFGPLLKLTPRGEITVAVAPFPAGMLTITGHGWRLAASHTTQTEDVKIVEFPAPSPLARPSETAP